MPSTQRLAVAEWKNEAPVLVDQSWQHGPLSQLGKDWIWKLQHRHEHNILSPW
jgi:hypothetical protein